MSLFAECETAYFVPAQQDFNLDTHQYDNKRSKLSLGLDKMAPPTYLGRAEARVQQSLTEATSFRSSHNPYKLVTVEERRRLYNLMSREIGWR